MVHLLDSSKILLDASGGPPSVEVDEGEALDAGEEPPSEEDSSSTQVEGFTVAEDLQVPTPLPAEDGETSGELGPSSNPLGSKSLGDNLPGVIDVEMNFLKGIT